MRTTVAKAACIAAFCVLTPLPATAQPQPIKCPAVGVSTGFFFENDTRWLTRTSQSDDDYTAAFRLYRVSPIGGSPSAARRFPFRPRDRRCFSVELAWGASIYTPNNTDATTLLIDQRPYTGWQYLSRGVSAYDVDANEIVQTVQTFEVHLGIVGPGAGGEDIQNNFHRVTGVERPNGYIRKAEGWHNQLKNEPGFTLGYRRRDLFAKAGTTVRWFDANVGGAGVFGNVFTHAEALLGTRVGYNLSNDIGPIERIQAAPPMMAADGEIRTTRPSRRNWEVYGFVQLRGRLVGRNISLDGNLFRDTPHSVDKHRTFAEIEGGGVLRYRPLRVTWRTVARSAESPLLNRTQKFGSLTVSWQTF
jgi:hypothetical protein